jgi:ribosomal-protein-alanine N-acetyltransferase
MTRSQTSDWMMRIERGFERHGYGLWALELPGETELAGFVGLVDVDRALPCAPAVEIGWRMDSGYWGRGFATEAAARVADYAFGELGLRDLVSTTSVPNARSQAVMERLGMTHDPVDDFEHPAVPAGHPLAPHVLYRLSAAQWQRSRTPSP